MFQHQLGPMRCQKPYHLRRDGRPGDPPIAMETQKVCLLFQKTRCKLYVSFGMAFQRLTHASNFSASGCKKVFLKSTQCVNCLFHPDRSSGGELGVPLMNKIRAKDGSFHVIIQFGLLRKLAKWDPWGAKASPPPHL